MSDNIVPLRPRDQVARRIQSGATTPLDKRLPVSMSSEVRLWRVLEGLRSVGLTARLDFNSMGIVIEDVQEVRP
jgi:hypothetical protein